jgi:hypothetical protein
MRLRARMKTCTLRKRWAGMRYEVQKDVERVEGVVVGQGE